MPNMPYTKAWEEIFLGKYVEGKERFLDLEEARPEFVRNMPEFRERGIFGHTVKIDQVLLQPGPIGIFAAPYIVSKDRNGRCVDIFGNIKESIKVESSLVSKQRIEERGEKKQSITEAFGDIMDIVTMGSSLFQIGNKDLIKQISQPFYRQGMVLSQDAGSFYPVLSSALEPINSNGRDYPACCNYLDPGGSLQAVSGIILAIPLPCYIFAKSARLSYYGGVMEKGEFSHAGFVHVSDLIMEAKYVHTVPQDDSGRPIEGIGEYLKHNLLVASFMAIADWP